jgi:hypothetical protein
MIAVKDRAWKYIESGLPDLGAVKVKVGLLSQKIMQVILVPIVVERPGGSPEDGHPVVGRRAVGPGVGPYIPVGAWVCFVHTAFEKPRMFV